MTTPPFDPILERAIARHGEEVLAARAPTVASADELRALPDHRYLAAMAKCVFSAGFRWSVVDAKWDGFEEAFLGFRPRVVAELDERGQSVLATDKRIVRNPQKISATVENARFLQAIAAEHGSVGAFIADWPEDDIVGLWEELSSGGSRLGGMTGPRFLRIVGRDTFLLTPDVCKALAELGITDARPTTKTARRAAQAAFGAWREQTGRSYGELSVALACSTGEVRRWSGE